MKVKTPTGMKRIVIPRKIKRKLEKNGDEPNEWIQKITDVAEDILAKGIAERLVSGSEDDDRDGTDSSPSSTMP